MIGRIKHEDIFENSNVTFTSDDSYKYLKTISVHVIQIICKYIDLVHEVSEKVDMSTDSSIMYMDAGLFYNYTTLPNVKLITDEQLFQIASDFKTEMDKSRELDNRSINIRSPIDNLIYFTKYMYIPVRVKSSTIPENLKLTYLRTWLSIVFALVTKPEYINKFKNIQEDGFDIYLTMLNDIKEVEKTHIAIKNISIDYLNAVLSNRAKKQTSVDFFKTMRKILFLINAEIVKKWCPNFADCITLNPNYDGSWLHPVDMDINEQLLKFREVVKD